MNFDNLDLTPGTIVMITIFVAVIIVIIVVNIVSRIRKANRERDDKQATIKTIRKEEERIACLPKLDTKYLIKIPACMGDFVKGTPRTFGSRYNRILVFDENGDGWLGLRTLSVYEGLHNGEYTQEDYWIPFRGTGEAYSGEPVTIDGQKIHLYPLWMNSGNTNIADWKLWASIERASDEAPKTVGGLSIHDRFTPFSRTRELKEKRRRLDAMKASVAPKEKK